MLSESYVYLVHSSFLLLCHTGQYMGQYSPKYWEFQTKSLFSVFLAFTTCAHSYTLSTTTLHTHTHTLNHTVDIEI